MNYRFLVLWYVFGVQSGTLRDPFCYPRGEVKYSCTGIGMLNGKAVCATLIINGNEVTVKRGDCWEGHEVVALTESSVTIKDLQGREHLLCFMSKKGPSTYAS